MRTDEAGAPRHQPARRLLSQTLAEGRQGWR